MVSTTIDGRLVRIVLPNPHQKWNLTVCNMIRKVVGEFILHLALLYLGSTTVWDTSRLIDLSYGRQLLTDRGVVVASKGKRIFSGPGGVSYEANGYTLTPQ